MDGLVGVGVWNAPVITPLLGGSQALLNAESTVLALCVSLCLALA
ncbi:MAG: hypothetical protein R2911_17950 [Caldilineaceae bacterium]